MPGWLARGIGDVGSSIGRMYGDISGANQADAARGAAQTQSQFGDKAIGLAQDVNNQNNKNLQPYISGGRDDYNSLSQQVNNGGFDSGKFNPTAGGNYQAPAAYQNQGAYKDPGFSLNGLAQDPGYQFRLQQGLNSVQGSAAARGNLHSGNTLAALTQYGQGFASNEANNAFNRYSNQRDFGNSQNIDQRNFGQAQNVDARNFGAQQFGQNREFNYGQQQDVYNSGVNNQAARFNRLNTLAGYGQNAVGAANAGNANYASNVGNIYQGQGNANAAGQIGAANAGAQGTQNLITLGTRALSGSF